MSKQKEIDKLEKERADLIFRRDQILYNLRGLESNLILFKSIKMQHENNIRILKNPRYITTVDGYRKTKGELRASLRRLYELQIDFNNHQVILERMEKKIIELNERYAILLQTQYAQVIRGKFGGKE
jgi:hypothetical protein